MNISHLLKTRLVWLVVLLALTGCKKIDSTVTVSYEGSGRITESSKIDCGTQCSAKYSISQATGTGVTGPAYDITLTASPATGFELFTWTSDCGKSLTCKQRIRTYCQDTPSFNLSCSNPSGVNINLHAVFVPAGSVAQEYRYGTDQNCLVDTSGILKCWGPAGFGGSSVPAVPNPTDVKLAWHAGCARSSDNRLYCWGSDAISQIPALVSPGPFTVQNSETCVVIGGTESCHPSGHYACALDQGQLQCWGNVPAIIASGMPTLTQPVALWGNGRNLCVQDKNGDHCWGTDLIGQTRIPALNQPHAIAADGSSTCALTAAGLRCWGFPAGGSQLDGTLVNAASLDLSDGHACVGDDAGMHCYWNNFTAFNLAPELQDSHRAKWSGYNVCGQDDNGLDCWNWLGHLNPPYHVDNLAQVTDFDVTGNGACAINGSNLRCWGESSFWPAGVSANQTLTLQQPRVVSVTGSAWCVGGDGGLQCRYQESTTALASKQPKNLRGITALQITSGNGCALHNGGVTCWGDNQYGINNVPALQNPQQIALGSAHACALDDSGVVCWGEKLQRPE